MRASDPELVEQARRRKFTAKYKPEVLEIGRQLLDRRGDHRSVFLGALSVPSISSNSPGVPGGDATGGVKSAVWIARDAGLRLAFEAVQQR